MSVGQLVKSGVDIGEGGGAGTPLPLTGNPPRRPPMSVDDTQVFPVYGTGLCGCGCGDPAPLNKRSGPHGPIGTPLRFIAGHHLWPAWKPDYIVTETGCWEWQRYRDSNGYGRAYDGVSMGWAHRVYYERAKGPVPAGHEVDHTCENPPCVNWDHLEAVTRPEHIRRTMQRLGKDGLHAAAAHLRSIGMTYQEIATALDYQGGKTSAAAAVYAAIRKGLVGADEIPPVARLTDSERDDIRSLAAMGIPQGELAKWYHLHPSHVSRIANSLRSGH